MRETFGTDTPLQMIFDAPAISAFSVQLLDDQGTRPQIIEMAETLVSLSGLTEEELEERLREAETAGAAV